MGIGLEGERSHSGDGQAWRWAIGNRSRDRDLEVVECIRARQRIWRSKNGITAESVSLLIFLIQRCRFGFRGRRRDVEAGIGILDLGKRMARYGEGSSGGRRHHEAGIAYESLSTYHRLGISCLPLRISMPRECMQG